MLKEALEFIFNSANIAANPVPSMRMTGARQRIVTLNGFDTEEELEAPRISRTANTLNSAALLIERFKGELPTVYLGESGVHAMLDDEDRLEDVRMNFELSDQYNVLLELKHGVSQKDLVKILRTKLAGCVSHENFLSIVRQLEFDVNRGSRGEVQHTKESLGRTVEKNVRAKAGEMPEELRITLPLFSIPHDIPTEITLVCAVTIDIDNEKISVETTGDSLIRERKRVLGSIADRLQQVLPEDAKLVFGSFVNTNNSVVL